MMVQAGMIFECFTRKYIQEKNAETCILRVNKQKMTLVVAPQRDNLAGVTDRQTFADSTCYHMIPNM
jgi:hypothetical protein